MPEFIDKSRYHQPGDEYIIDIRYGDGEEYGMEGYVITTTLQSMEFRIDNYQFSTESWGVDLSLAHEQLLNRKVKYVGWLGRGVKDDVEYARSALVEMILEGDGEDDIVVDIDIHNCHNGAYPHSYYVKWGSYEDEGTL
ncbi:hypothetical protein MIR68_005150 [Amoeboaphelidium protococcarum]|nr:hypothetical protein MIR68_005150 [Amoeboaphelidium protococcarum]